MRKINEADGSVDDLGVVPDGNQINRKLTRSGFYNKGKFADKSILVNLGESTIKSVVESVQAKNEAIDTELRDLIINRIELNLGVKVGVKVGNIFKKPKGFRGWEKKFREVILSMDGKDFTIDEDKGDTIFYVTFKGKTYFVGIPLSYKNEVHIVDNDF